MILRTRRSQEQNTNQKGKVKIMKIRKTVIRVIIALTNSNWMRPALVTFAILATSLVVTGCPSGHHH